MIAILYQTGNLASFYITMSSFSTVITELEYALGGKSYNLERIKCIYQVQNVDMTVNPLLYFKVPLAVKNQRV